MTSLQAPNPEKSMTGQLETVVSLHKTQIALVDARERLAGVPDWMRELHDEHSEKKSEIDAVEATRDAAAQKRREAEASLEDAQERLKKYQGQIGQVSRQCGYRCVVEQSEQFALAQAFVAINAKEY